MSDERWQNTLLEIIDCAQALRDGKTLEYRHVYSAIDPYSDWDGGSALDFGTFQYRVKPEPIERWVWQEADGFLGAFNYESEGDCRSAHQGRDGRPVLLREVQE